MEYNDNIKYYSDDFDNELDRHSHHHYSKKYNHMFWCPFMQCPFMMNKKMKHYRGSDDDEINSISDEYINDDLNLDNDADTNTDRDLDIDKDIDINLDLNRHDGWNNYSSHGSGYPHNPYFNRPHGFYPYPHPYFNPIWMNMLLWNKRPWWWM